MLYSASQLTSTSTASSDEMLSLYYICRIFWHFLHCLHTPHGLRGSNAPWFMCWFWRYINRLFVCLLNFLPPYLRSLLLSLCFFSYLFTSLLVYFLTYLSTPSRIDPFHFQARGRRRRQNLALVFLGSFYAVVYFVMDACFLCCICFIFSVLSREIGWEERLRNDLFCVAWDVTQSITVCIT